MTLLTANETINEQKSTSRVAWLFPSLARGSYWHPLFKRFSQQYPSTVIYTGRWSGFAKGFEGDFDVEVVGDTSFVNTKSTGRGYNRTYIYPSLKIIPKLLKFRPNVILTSAFSLWTLVALGFKLCFGSKVIVLFDGVSPGVDSLNSGIRVFPRRIMNGLIDAYISNSRAGKDYLTKVVLASPDKVFVKPYLVPDTSVLAPTELAPELPLKNLRSSARVTFLCVGQIVPRKGLHFLLQACALLRAQGCDQFAVWIIGDGESRSQLEALTREKDLADCVHWLGTVDYHHLGAYFTQSDVFVFPTLEDIWGMVVPEAMAFGQPIICSKWAGATEIMVEGSNGYIFDPNEPEVLETLMRRFIEQPGLIDKMGDRSKQLAATLSPQSTAAFFCDLAAK